MMDYLASMYIDNELALSEKIQFVDRIRSDPHFYRNTRELLLQEELLRVPPDTSRLPNRPPGSPKARTWYTRIVRPILYAAAGFAAAGLLWLSLPADPAPARCINRFVIYEPSAHRVDLAGSFTGWQPMPMAPVGDSGYWEVRLHVPSGEHRFAYILDGARHVADPSLPVREKDDFGGENSILNVGGQV